MREWLTVIIVLLILGILLDGWRRMRNARRDSLRMPRSIYKKSSMGASAPEVDNYTSELPNGGARVVSQRRPEPEQRTEPSFNMDSVPDDDYEEDEEELPSSDLYYPPQAEEPPRRERESARIPQQVTLNLDESVPMLMESVEDDQPEPPRSKPGFSADTDGRVEPTLRPGTGRPSGQESRASNPPPAEDAEEMDASEVIEPEEVLIINVMAPSGHYFQGDALLEIIFDSGLRYGSMNIFHRYRDARGGGPVLFSLANMVKPGTFDLDAMEQFQTPGVSLFMTLPMKSDSIAAFDLMLDTAKTLAETLSGELKDENRSVMTRQTMEHDRQRVLDFERRQLSRVPG